jgi:plasmid stabilization system protein ParE
VKHTVIFRTEARDEAVEAAGYIADHGSPEAALLWYHGLEEAVASLASMPTRCPYAREHETLIGVELRQLLFKSHRLIFTIRGNEVHVLHVRHVAQANTEMVSDPERPLG